MLQDSCGCMYGMLGSGTGGGRLVLGVESQNRLCFVSEVLVLKDWLHLTHLICILQLACIRL